MQFCFRNVADLMLLYERGCSDSNEEKEEITVKRITMLKGVWSPCLLIGVLAGCEGSVSGTSNTRKNGDPNTGQNTDPAVGTDTRGIELLRFQAG